MRYVFGVLLLAVVSGMLLAQSVPDNEPVPACTRADAGQFLEVIAETKWGELLATLSKRLADDKKGDYAWAVDSVVMLRRLYERDIVPELPACSLVLYWRLHTEAALNGYGLLYAAGGLIQSGDAPDSLDDRITALSDSIVANARASSEYVDVLAELAQDD